jgi:hypothetical protein
MTFRFMSLPSWSGPTPMRKSILDLSNSVRPATHLWPMYGSPMPCNARAAPASRDSSEIRSKTRSEAERPKGTDVHLCL